MGKLAAKQGDRVVGTDTHLVLMPGTPPTQVPQPLPFSGTITGGLSGDVSIMGKPAAVVGCTAVNSPAHLPHGRDLVHAALTSPLALADMIATGKSVEDVVQVGFGEGIARRFAAEGAKVLVADIDGARAERAMARKRADYFAAGTKVVWDVDVLREEVVRVFRPSDPEQPVFYRRGDMAEAEPALPGWQMPVEYEGVGAEHLAVRSAADHHALRLEREVLRPPVRVGHNDSKCLHGHRTKFPDLEAGSPKLHDHRCDHQQHDAKEE